MNEEPTNLSLGIDVGGTFTDVVLGSPSADPVLCKLPSTPSSPAEAVLTGMTRALARGNRQTDQLSFWGHGTTIATNTLLERTGARVGLLTTAGFGDLLEIGRQQRPTLYDLFADKPKPLVPPSRCFEISERLAADGTVVRPLSEPQVREAIRQLRQIGTEALAVCFLHAYGNDQHERRVAEIVQSEWPEVDLSLSVDILPEFREYERLSTTVLNAYLGPVTSRYLTALEEELEQRNLCCTPYVLQSNGHLMTFKAARRRPVRLAASGPSAGVMGAAMLGRTLGYGKILTLDMGGTSADVAVVKDGGAQVSTVRQFVGHSLKITMVDVLSIGAGGGSVAWVDGGDFLRVGPQSAGAVPGPACYGHGGTEPTVTDAHLVLGRLNPRGLLDGEIPLKRHVAVDALRRLGSRLKCSPEDAAQGIIRLANAEMARAIRSVTAARGEDPRAFIIFAYGGAGPLHAADLARVVGLKQVVIPPWPGSFCAWGMLATEIGMDFGRTFRALLAPSHRGAIEELFSNLEQEARQWLHGEGIPQEHQRMQRTMDARYVGQDYELSLPVPGDLDSDLGGLVESFHVAHENAYGYALRDRHAECVTLRVAGREATKQLQPPFETGQRQDSSVAPSPIDERTTWWEETGLLQTPIYRRDHLPKGWQGKGPAVIEQMDTTVLVPPTIAVTVDTWGNLIMDL